MNLGRAATGAFLDMAEGLGALPTLVGEMIEGRKIRAINERHKPTTDLLNAFEREGKELFGDLLNFSCSANYNRSDRKSPAPLIDSASMHLGSSDIYFIESDRSRIEELIHELYDKAGLGKPSLTSSKDVHYDTNVVNLKFSASSESAKKTGFNAEDAKEFISKVQDSITTNKAKITAIVEELSILRQKYNDLQASHFKSVNSTTELGAENAEQLNQALEKVGAKKLLKNYGLIEESFSKDSYFTTANNTETATPFSDQQDHLTRRIKAAFNEYGVDVASVNFYYVFDDYSTSTYDVVEMFASYEIAKDTNICFRPELDEENISKLNSLSDTAQEIIAGKLKGVPLLKAETKAKERA